MNKSKISYKDAMAKIEAIVEKIEAEEPDVDDLGTMIKEALALIKSCKEKLKNTEEDLDKIFNSVE